MLHLLLSEYGAFFENNKTTPPPPKKKSTTKTNPKSVFGFEEMDKHMLITINKTTSQVYLKLLNLAFYTYKRPKMTTSDSRLFIYF